MTGLCCFWGVMPHGWGFAPPGIDTRCAGCCAGGLPHAGRCRAPGLVPNMAPGNDAGRLGPARAQLSPHSPGLKAFTLLEALKAPDSAYYSDAFTPSQKSHL